MEVLSCADTGTRPKREDCRLTKHDPNFSKWKILIGASDWEDHSMGKGGAERYRTQSLPNCETSSCPGVYELGIATSHPQSGRDTQKLDSGSIVLVVYVGHADNLRTRLQQYGRDGVHLENGCSGLFGDVFSRGLSIVYRYAPMKSKEDAERAEKHLLDQYDYAWNKGSNGERRQDDIRKRLDRRQKASQLALSARKFLLSNQRQGGIKIRAGPNSSDMDNNTIFPRIPGIRRLQQKPVQCGSGDFCNDICGVATGDGSICTAPPVPGRKRCAMHKGLKVVLPDQHCSDFQDQKFSRSREANCPCDHATNETSTPTSTCGFILDNGSPCKRMPVQGNKRCWEHKGRRIREAHLPCDHATNETFAPTCGFILDNGSPCKRKPVQGNKRCWEHEGRRIREAFLPSARATNETFTFAPTCGFILDNGCPCKRMPVQGNKRCWQHKGRRIW